jgi:hypothetical protein
MIGVITTQAYCALKAHRAQLAVCNVELFDLSLRFY